MKATELRDRSDEELQETYEETRQALFDLKVRRALSDGEDNPMQARTLRRTIARIKTIERERERG